MLQNWKRRLEEIFDRKLSGVNEQLLLMNKRLQESIDSLAFLSEKYDSVVQKLCEIEEANRLADLEVASLRNEVGELKNIAILNKQNLNDLEQYSRRDCLEIRGVPLPEISGHNEDIVDIVMKVVESTDVKLDQDDIACP